MGEFGKSPDLSFSFFERVFPRTYALLSEKERARWARESLHFKQGEDLEYYPLLLQHWKWVNERAFIPDLARAEALLEVAVGAPELEIQGFEGITKASEPEWYLARFRFDPAHALIESDWPLDQICTKPELVYQPAPGYFLVYRTEGKSAIRRLGENEAALIRSLSLGVPLGKILERKSGPDFDALTFQRWIESGFLRAIDWATV